jgi:hypothetical protein
MTERAKKIMEAYEAEDTYNFPKDGVVAAIRAIVNEHQYYQCCRDQDIEDMVVDARLLYELADELEALK